MTPFFAAARRCAQSTYLEEPVSLNHILWKHRTRSLVVGLSAVIIAACLDKDPPTAAKGPHPARSVSYDAGWVSKFSAWDWSGHTGIHEPMVVQPYNTLDGTQYRQQWQGHNLDTSFNFEYIQPLFAFADSFRNKLYILGDEPNKPGTWGVDSAGADAYARRFCLLRDSILNHDPNAKFSPGGFTDSALTTNQQNWLYAGINTHCTGGVSAAVSEWTFHYMPEMSVTLDSIKSWIDGKISWAQTHGNKNIVLGSYTLDGVMCPTSSGSYEYLDRLRKFRDYVNSNPRINSTRYLNYFNDADCHNLRLASLGNYDPLTPQGVVLAGYIADNNTYYTQNNVWGDLQLGHVYWQSQTWIGGKQYFSPVGQHASGRSVSQAQFLIPEGTSVFNAVFGVARQDGNNCTGHLRGSVYVDDVLKWTGIVNGPTETAVTLTGPISLGYNPYMLRLETSVSDSTPGQDIKYCAHATWGDPHYATLIPNSLSPTISGPAIRLNGEPGSWSVAWDPANPTWCEWTVESTPTQSASCEQSFTDYFAGPATRYVNVKVTDNLDHQGTATLAVNVSGPCYPAISCRQSERPLAKKPPGDR